MEINSFGIKRVAFTQERIRHWDNVARDYNRWVAGRGYHRRLIEFFRYLIPEGSRILEVGCGAGDLLSALKPSRGVGVDFSPEMIALARKRHPDLEFIEWMLTSLFSMNHSISSFFLIWSMTCGTFRKFFKS